MGRRTTGFCGLIAGLLAMPALAAPPPVRLFGQLPLLDNITLSADGKRWAALMGDDTSVQVQVRNLADNALLSVAPTGKAKVRSLLWSGNDHVIATVSTTVAALGYYGKGEFYQLLGLDLSKGTEWFPAMRRVTSVRSFVGGLPTAVIRDGRPMIVVPGLEDRGRSVDLSLVEIDLRRGTGEVSQSGNALTVDWLIDVDGRPVARADGDGESGKWRLLAKRDGGWHEIYSEIAPIDGPSLVSFGRDTSSVIISSRKSGRREFYEIKVADGSISGPSEALRGDNVILDPRTRTVIGTVDVKLDRIDYSFFDPKDQALLRGLNRAYPDEQVTLQSWSDDRKTIIIEVQGPKSGIALVHVDRANGRAEYMADRYAGLGPDLLNPVTTFRYKAGDGMEIPAYLTLPKGREAKGLPLIVLAHGGPESRDMPGFDWWAQALASRGYAVLQPQFRGSTGFGEAHKAAGYGEWGRKMQSDLSDGVRDLVAKGTVDAKRVCIAGASYGGYAAMAGVSVEQGVYRCASAVAGVADLRRMLTTEVQNTGSERNDTLRYWQRFMGAKNASDAGIDAWSPARLASRVSVPLQLIHGKDDTVVRIEQSRMMRDALQKAGKAADYLELPGEDHWLSRPATRIAMLEAQVAFLEKHNPPN